MWRVVCDFRKDFFIIINFICQDKRRKTDCITTEYNMVTYVEQRERHRSAVTSALNKIEISVKPKWPSVL